MNKKRYLVSYYLRKEDKPKNHIVEIDETITDLELPYVLQNHLSSIETACSIYMSYVSMDITIINFWQVK